MVDIKNRIENIKAYFVGMNVQTLEDGTQAIYVITRFPPKWTVAKDIMDKFGVTVQETADRQFYFCATMEDGFEILFNAIDYNINVMKETEERAKLLSEKISELESLFNDVTNGLDYLKSLEFSFKKKKKVKKDAKISKEKEIVNNDNKIEETNV